MIRFYIIFAQQRDGIKKWKLIFGGAKSARNGAENIFVSSGSPSAHLSAAVVLAKNPNGGTKTHFEYGQQRAVHTHSSGRAAKWQCGSKCGGRATGIGGFN